MKDLVSVLDYSLPPLLFQSVSSSFLSLIFVLPPHASFPVEADLTRLPEIPCAFAPKPQIMTAERCAQVCICPPLPGFTVSCAVLFGLLTTCVASWRWGSEDS